MRAVKPAKRHAAPPGPLWAQVGVFVSLVSTKIPFKGAGKEYIGAWATVATVRAADQPSSHGCAYACFQPTGSP